MKKRSDPIYNVQPKMNDTRAILRHFLAALAYRTQKALRGAPASFGTFQAGQQVRSPAELVRHMTSVLGYACSCFEGAHHRPDPLPDLGAEVTRFHATLEELGHHFSHGTPLKGITEERLLQGPLSDAMTHAGQLAMLRRLAGSPVPPESFIDAVVEASNLGPEQSEPASPDATWPEAPSHVAPELTLAELQQALARAWMERDRRTIEEIIAPEWRAAGPDGGIADRRQVLSEVFDTGVHKIHTVHIDDVAVRVYGEAAVVTGRTHGVGEFAGSPYEVVIRFTDTFVRRAGHWQAVASHASVLADAR